ncbi:MAG: hypothetical protein JNM84_07185 [Planctomycetes bacterium]|nr:hypothetical protein [Planctomycetota bacterium]
MPSSTLMNGLFGLSVAGCAVLAWMHYERRPTQTEARLEGRIAELESQLRRVSAQALSASASSSEGAQRSDAEALSTLRRGLLEGGGDDLEQILQRLDRALQEGRDAAGVDHEGEIIARHYTRLQIEKLRGIGASAADEVLRRIDFRDEHKQPLPAEFRSKLLAVLVEIAPERGREASARLFTAEGEDLSLRLSAAHRLKEQDPAHALRLAREVIDRQRGRPALSFQNLHELVGIVGELGQVLGKSEVEALLRDLAVRQDWEMSARHRAISWIETLGILEAYDDLERVVKEPGHNHYTRVCALQAMRRLDPERLLPILRWLVEETSLDPTLKQNAESMREQIETELAGRRSK